MIQDPRPEIAEGMRACRASILKPANGHGLGGDLRHALAARMAAQIGQTAMAAEHRAAMTGGDHTTIAEGGAAGDPQTAAMVAHADLVTQTPSRASEADIRALEAAGLTNPQIVALSELIAFVNYDARVRAGMALLEGIA